MTPPTAAEMQAHVEEIAAVHGIRVNYVEGLPEGAQAFVRLRMIRTPPITDLLSYYIALHELGHLVGRGRRSPQLEREANGWVYAIETARWPQTPEVSRAISSSLQSYGGGDLEYGGGGVYKNRRGEYRLDRRKKVPDGHPYWSLLKHGTLTPPLTTTHKETS